MTKVNGCEVSQMNDVQFQKAISVHFGPLSKVCFCLRELDRVKCASQIWYHTDTHMTHMWRALYMIRTMKQESFVGGITHNRPY